MDAVNVEFGQHIDIGESKSMRFHAGVQYADITTQIAQYSATSGAPAPSRLS